jgi:hypothetical protein
VVAYHCRALLVLDPPPPPSSWKRLKAVVPALEGWYAIEVPDFLHHGRAQSHLEKTETNVTVEPGWLRRRLVIARPVLHALEIPDTLGTLFSLEDMVMASGISFGGSFGETGAKISIMIVHR